MLPHGVLALSISTVAFPSLAALYSRGDREGFARLLDRTMRPLIFLSVPASLGLWLVGKPVVSVIFESGNFDAASTELVSAALTWFAIGLVGYGLTEIITRVFYAMRDTRTPVVTGILTIILNLILCSLFIESLGHRGLALALSVTTAAEAIIMMLFLKHRSGRIFSSGFFGWLMKVLTAGAAMAAVIVLTVPWLNGVLDADVSLIIHLLYFSVCIALYTSTFLLASWVLRIPEFNSSLSKILNRMPARVRAQMTWLSIGEDPA
jgi:putative peptidoglycan lipid II flippase